LRLIKRRKTYDGLRALRGKLQWIGDDEAAGLNTAKSKCQGASQGAGLPYEGEIDPIFLDLALICMCSLRLRFRSLQPVMRPRWTKRHDIGGFQCLD
jgi:hypothetical protein